MYSNVLTWDNEAIGEVDVDDTIFGITPRVDIIAAVVRWQRAKRRAGTHDVKNRAEIVGSGRKIMRQKGSGGARHSTRKVAQFRGGGRAFGPLPRSHAHDLPKKIRKLGLASVLADKYQSEKMYVIVDGKLESPKTKDFLARIANFDGVGSILFVVENKEEYGNLLLATKNLHKVNVIPAIGANVYDIVRHDSLFMTRESLDLLEKRINQ